MLSKRSHTQEHIPYVREQAILMITEVRLWLPTARPREASWILKAFSTLTWVIFMWIGTYVRIHQAFRISIAVNFVTCVLALNRKKKKEKKGGR